MEEGAVVAASEDDLAAYGPGTILRGKSGHAWEMYAQPPRFRSTNGSFHEHAKGLVRADRPLTVIVPVPVTVDDPLIVGEEFTPPGDLDEYAGHSYWPVHEHLRVMRDKHNKPNALWLEWDALLQQWDSEHSAEALARHGVRRVRRELKDNRAHFISRGYVTATTGLQPNLHVGDQVTLDAWRDRNSPVSTFRIVWALTPNPGDSLSGGATVALWETTPDGAVRRVPLSDLRWALDNQHVPRRRPGRCQCCDRKPPKAAKLDRDANGMCWGCHRWHEENSFADAAPDPRCEHVDTKPWSSPPAGARWWRANPATSPVHSSIAENEGSSWFGLERSFETGAGWGVALKGHTGPDNPRVLVLSTTTHWRPGAPRADLVVLRPYGRKAKRDVPLIFDLARHEAAEVLRAVVAGRPIPSEYLAPELIGGPEPASQ